MTCVHQFTSQMLTGSVSPTEEKDIYARLQRGEDGREPIRVRLSVAVAACELIEQLCYVTVSRDLSTASLLKQEA